MGWTPIPGDTLVQARWRNGLGTSRDIAGAVDPDSGLLWQVSIAELEQDGPFSHYPHCERVFTPIAGDPPPELAFHGGPFEPCPLLMPRRFAGDVPTLSRIPARGRAFNAIVDRRRFGVEVRVLRLEAGMAAEAAGLAVVHCLQGGLDAEGRVLGAGDSARGAGRFQAAQPTVALLVELAPL